MVEIWTRTTDHEMRMPKPALFYLCQHFLFKDHSIFFIMLNKTVSILVQNITKPNSRALITLRNVISLTKKKK